MEHDFGRAAVISVLAVCLTVIILGSQYLYTQRIDYLTQRGYEHTTLQGESGWAWKKVK